MKPNYLKQVQDEYSQIKAYEEDDLEWWNEGLDLIKAGEFTDAEKKFKMLIMSQPENSDGYNGLAMVYSKMERFEEAEYFIDIAIEKVKKSIQAGETDKEMLDIVRNDKREIQELAQKKKS